MSARLEGAPLVMLEQGAAGACVGARLELRQVVCRVVGRHAALVDEEYVHLAPVNLQRWKRAGVWDGRSASPQVRSFKMPPEHGAPTGCCSTPLAIASLAARLDPKHSWGVLIRDR